MRSKLIAMMKLGLAISLFWSLSCTKSCGKHEPSSEATRGVFFEDLKDNDEVVSPLKVTFGVMGMTVRPALEDVKDKTSGHHHILVDHPVGYIEKGMAIPADPRHIHFGKGETTAILQLLPGIHTLSLQFGDGAHLSYGRDMSATITVKVVEPTAKPSDSEAAPPAAPPTEVAP